MFHWNNSRIKGHICMNYVAYTVLIYLQNKLSSINKKMSEIEIKNVLNEM